MKMGIILADATNEQVGVFIAAAVVVIGFILMLLAIAAYFATRREVDDLKERMDKLEADLDDKTSKIHNRVNRLLAGQMLIAGRVGCELTEHKERLGEIMKELESEES
jgi:cell division protein FtsL